MFAHGGDMLGHMAPAALADPPTFSHVYDEHARAVYGAALRILGNPAQAQDVTQDVFLKLWRRPRRFDPRRGELGSYLRLMARSRALDLYREGQAAGRASDRMRLVVARDEGGVDDRPAPAVPREGGPAGLRAALARRPRRPGGAGAAARRAARGARARLLGRPDRRSDRPPRGHPAGDGEEPDPARDGQGA